jgi:hypothetical protein
MNPPSQDIKDFLLESSTGLTLVFSTDLFVAKMPETPDECACVYDTGGWMPMADYEYDMPSIQIRVRGERMGYRAGWLLANDIKGALHGKANETINNTRYIHIICNSDIMFVAWDESDRPIFSINFEIHRSTA